MRGLLIDINALVCCESIDESLFTINFGILEILEKYRALINEKKIVFKVFGVASPFAPGVLKVLKSADEEHKINLTVSIEKLISMLGVKNIDFSKEDLIFFQTFGGRPAIALDINQLLPSETMVITADADLRAQFNQVGFRTVFCFEEGEISNTDFEKARVLLAKNPKIYQDVDDSIFHFELSRSYQKVILNNKVLTRLKFFYNHFKNQGFSDDKISEKICFLTARYKSDEEEILGIKTSLASVRFEILKRIDFFVANTMHCSLSLEGGDFTYSKSEIVEFCDEKTMAKIFIDDDEDQLKELRNMKPSDDIVVIQVYREGGIPPESAELIYNFFDSLIKSELQVISPRVAMGIFNLGSDQENDPLPNSVVPSLWSN